jgi:hypothetical protein
MIQRIKWIFTGLFILVPLLSPGQQQDLQLWTRASLKYDLNKKSRIYIKEELRFKNNIGHLSSDFKPILIINTKQLLFSTKLVVIPK